ncbi:hypothetical protein OG21DRAFT_1488869 [Imleria badia]|nr:hypothetical protein OG21DRAFT_1488869 [Imleria badia]
MGLQLFCGILLKVAHIISPVNQMELYPKMSLPTASRKGSSSPPTLPWDLTTLQLKNPVIGKIAGKYGVQPANILIFESLHANKPILTVLPKSVTNSRILSKSTIDSDTQLDVIDKSATYTLDRT